ncbi:kinesin light chain [Viridothelium virens]|uniref:Kinesin light chain n=1 Tax=Viridothelium virens TaxID=1048519 RepID=A0A6A6GY11_VIRVR|nr:kinesin light chain [Viridothelium virens]
MTRRLQHDEYTVGWICALPDELTAAREMLDEEHQDLPSNGNDTNIYCLGCIGEHNVVLATLPAGLIGIASATAVAMQIKSTFPAIRFGLMVGIGGGVPSNQADIRLGDVIVSQPGKGHVGVIQYDFGKSIPNGFDQTGFLNSPPLTLLGAVIKLQSNHRRGRSSLLPHLSRLSELPGFARDEAGSDVLYEAEYNHAGDYDCTSCDNKRQVQRVERRKEKMEERPMVHYGTIASGNQVMRDSITRNKVSSEFGGVLCFEMEAAGLMNNFPCLVIRGICDYADSHKNKKWQPYAAGTAAAYAKELLLLVPAIDVSTMRTIHEATREYLPFPPNRQFTGRSTELDILKRKLFTNKECQKTALVGLGGAGKTQIALHFTYWVKKNYPDFSIFWMPVLSTETFEQACIAIAKELGIRHCQESKEDVKYVVQQRLSAKTVGKWLLIVDNADDMDLLFGEGERQGLLDFLPRNDNGLILFTTRTFDVAQAIVGSDVVEVVRMEMQEAMAMFQKSLVQVKPLHDEMVDFLSELDCLPLAITQAAAYINRNRSSMLDYLRLLKQTEQDAVILLSTEFHDNARYTNSANAVAKTWLISFNQILEYDKMAADLLAFISSIEWKAIPRSILPVVQSEARIASAIGTLCSYSFLERRNFGQMFDMHRLVHLATRMWISQNGREVVTRKTALKHLVEVFPSDEYTNRDIWRKYMPHVACIEKYEQCQNTEGKSMLCLNVGRCLIVDGRMHEAVLWLQKSCDWRDRNLAEDNTDRLASRRALARAYRANGQVKEAIDLLERIVAIEAGLTEDHPNQLASQHALAEAYRANGQVKEAIDLLERVVIIKAEVLTEDHPDRLASQHALALAYADNGQVTDAIKLLECVVNIERRIMAEYHPSRRASERALAGLNEELQMKPETGQTSGPSIENLVDRKEDERQFNPAPQVSQALSQVSNACVTIPDRSLADQGMKSSSTLRRFLMRRLRRISKRDK